MNNVGSNAKNSVTGECVACGAPAIYECERCQDSYCSTLCQRKNWPTHRLICFRMPPLVPFEPYNMTDDDFHVRMPEFETMAQKSSKIEEPMVMSSASPHDRKKRVVVIGFRSTNLCFVRSTLSADAENYALISRKINEYGKSAPLLQNLPELNTYAVAEWNSTKYRVKILCIRSRDIIKVLFCDYGWIMRRSLNQLWEISDEIVALPNISYTVKLRNVSNYICKRNDLFWLHEFDDEECEMLEHSSSNEVELIVCASGKSLNDWIECRFAGCAIFHKTKNTPPTKN